MDSKARAAEVAGGDWYLITGRLVQAAEPHLREVLQQRFAAHWPQLIKSAWAPFLKNAIDDQAEIEFDWDEWERQLLARAYEALFMWAEDREEHRAGDVRVDADQLIDLDRDIKGTAARLRDLLRQRLEVQDRGFVRSDWRGGLNPWHCIDKASAAFPSWRSNCEADLAAFLATAGRLSTRGPGLADLLDVTARSDVSPPQAAYGDDDVSLNRGRGAGMDSPAEWMDRFFAAVRETFDFVDPNGLRCLSWFTTPGISIMLSVAAGRPPGEAPFTETAVKAARARYLQRES